MRSLSIGAIFTTPLATLVGDRDDRERTGAVLFLLAAVLFVVLGVFNLGQPLLEHHAFRQTQTALTAYWLRQDGFSLAYETPVVGYPWSIPFEFPLYQTLVAGLSALTGIGLDPLGRLVSLACTLGVCLPLYRSLRLLGLERGAAHYANALFLSLPTYLFWGSTFMIESLALLLSVGAGYYLVKMYQQGVARRDLAWFTLLLALALLQKVTTAAPLALVGTAAFGLRLLRQWRQGTPLRSPQAYGAVQVLLGAAVALAIAYGWLQYTDAVKQRNEVGRMLTSGALALWNYGSLEQRFGMPFLNDVLLHRIVLPSTATGLGLLALAWLFFRRGERPAKVAAVLGLVLFLLPMAVFTNLHFVHDYYQVANLAFLAVAVGCALYAVCGRLQGAGRLLAPVLMVLLFVSNLHYFSEIYLASRLAWFSEVNSRTLRIATYLRGYTRPEQPILVFGYDWSSELAYYAQRKAFTVPARGTLEQEAIEHPGRFLPRRPGAVVSCPGRNVAKLRVAIAAKYPDAKIGTVGGCRIYLLDPP